MQHSLFLKAVLVVNALQGNNKHICIVLYHLYYIGASISTPVIPWFLLLIIGALSWISLAIFHWGVDEDGMMNVFMSVGVDGCGVVDCCEVVDGDGM